MENRKVSENLQWKKSAKEKSVECNEMASESDIEQAQTQSQSTDIDINGLIQPESEDEPWGTLDSKHIAVKSFGE